MEKSYRPELDVTPELSDAYASYYQSLIGILRWVVELVQVDICLEVSIMYLNLVLPRIGHLRQILKIFSHIKKYHNSELVNEPTRPEINEADFEVRAWATSEFGHFHGS